METLIADQTLPEKLDKVSRPTAIVLPDGRYLGVFTPTQIPPDLEMDIPYEEILRRIDDPATKWVSAADVEARLRAI